MEGVTAAEAATEAESTERCGVATLLGAVVAPGEAKEVNLEGAGLAAGSLDPVGEEEVVVHEAWGIGGIGGAGSSGSGGCSEGG